MRGETHNANKLISPTEVYKRHINDLKVCDVLENCHCLIADHRSDNKLHINKTPSSEFPA